MITRNWCARAKFTEGKTEFILGTVQAESEMQAFPLLREMLRDIVPFIPDDALEYFAVIPGLVLFHGDHDGPTT